MHNFPVIYGIGVSTHNQNVTQTDGEYETPRAPAVVRVHRAPGRSDVKRRENCTCNL